MNMQEGSEFSKAYKALNPRQKQAVDTIEGPVLVVAGPGTGKTQLLSMRVANILRRTDTLPSNILCLTFTESGAAAMRQRLLRLMGQDAYKVAIHTFHSFGTEIINHNPEYFYSGARFRPADELSSREVLEPIFEGLGHSNPLASTMNGEFTALRDTQSAIANLKKAGLKPADLRSILKHNESFITFAEPILTAAFDTPRFSKKNLPACEVALEKLQTYTDEAPFPHPFFKPLAVICAHELARALDAAEAANSTTPMTAFRNRWLERNHKREFVFKDRARDKKLRTVADIYQKYLAGMSERELFDFDDMILNVITAMEEKPELRFNLQEKYLYILVDEFQDTNGAQLRLLQNLTDNPVHEGRPNVLVVGDDDQAIYAFQGAEIGNILQFKDMYREPSIITLTDNYRSTNDVLANSRAVISQGQQRLETTLEGIDKTLTAHHTHQKSSAQLHHFKNPTEQYHWIVSQIQTLLTDGVAPSEIAVLGRNHRQLMQFLPYLREANIAISYERRNNVLEAEHVRAITLMARVVNALGEQRFDIVESLLPELLSYDFWGLSTDELWKLSLSAYRQHKFWVELMLEGDGESKGKLKRIAEFLIVSSHEARVEPLDYMLDRFIGSQEEQAPNDAESEDELVVQTGPDEEEFISPLRDFYFNKERLEQNPSEYLTMLSNLSVIRQRLREYRPDRPLMLNDFVTFIDLHERSNMSIVDTSDHSEDSQAIHLMTAHKSKGLEFDAVFILSCQDNIWGDSARSRSSSVRFPHNLAIEPAGQGSDDNLRLFFVAMTRARTMLQMCSYDIDDSGKESLPAAFLQGEPFTAQPHPAAQKPTALAQSLEPTWRLRHIHAPSVDRHQLLQPQLDRYQLSVTHLNNFLDVTNGGPQAFLLQNLLRFPQAMGSGAVFGSAIHAVLQRAHVHLASSGERRPLEDILHDFELQLQKARLNERDFDYLLEKAGDVLPGYLHQRYDSFTPHQLAEYSFTNQGVTIGEARLTGAIDLLDVDKESKEVIVTDYKTGRAVANWSGRTDYEKIKLHKYRQQLMMYKLLVEESRDFGGPHTVTRGIIDFVEPDTDGAVHQLVMVFDDKEMAQFKHLIEVVWRHIMALDLPDTSKYPANYHGVLAFERDLLEK